MAEHDFEPHVDLGLGLTADGRVIPYGHVHAPTHRQAQELGLEYAMQGYHVTGLEGEIAYGPKGSSRLHGFAGVKWDNVDQKDKDDKSTRWAPNGSAWGKPPANPSAN